MSGYSPKVSSTGFDTSKPASERYRILGRIATGGMAEIYLARMLTSAGIEREVVLKRLMPELQTDQEFVQMFYDEARIASQMRHPNIVQIYELGELDGSLFISMELLRGVNLRDLLARVHNRDEQVPVPIAIRIACGAAEALSYAHRFTDAGGRLLNVVHRDVSPQNIILTYDGTVKLVDFGVAKAEGRIHQTRAGLIKGKFAYMSPEQISGQKIDGRSDLFALAEVFYELLLKRHPFYAATDMEVLRSILDVDPPHPLSLDSGFPAELATILVRGLQKNPGDRFPNAAAMHDALEAFLQAQRTPATTIMLGRYVRELFSDRVETEQRAREIGDEALLTESMTAGAAEPMRAPQPRRKSQSRIQLPADGSGPDEGLLIPAAKSETRDRVVEIARSPSSPVEDPAERGAPAFLAHSGYTDSGDRKKRFKSQVRRLFDDPADPASRPSSSDLPSLEESGDHPTDRDLRAEGELLRSDGEIRRSDGELRRGDGEMLRGDEVDAGELPTMLGTISAQELAELRRVESTSSAESAPAVASGGTERSDPEFDNGSTRPRSPIHFDGESARPDLEETVSPSRELRSDPAALKPPRRTGQPTPEGGAKAAHPAHQPRGQPAVTPRSRTVVRQTQTAVSTADRWGLLLFIAGLGALAGAIIYAVILYAGAQVSVMRLEVRSTPPGAAIFFDGADTAALTPAVFQNVISSQEHTLELRLDGYETHKRKIPPASDLGELIINWTFRPPSPR